MARCPKCGESEHYYPMAVPTGERTEDGKIKLTIPDESKGHCLHCGYDG